VQSYNKNELKETQTVETEKELIDKLNKQLNRDDITHVVIGKMPKKGNFVKISGLVYTVTYSDKVTGKLHLKLDKTSKEKIQDE
jgi:hypothetical protein